jgi:hypothetical protein
VVSRTTSWGEFGVVEVWVMVMGEVVQEEGVGVGEGFGAGVTVDIVPPPQPAKSIAKHRIEKS